MRVAAIPTTHRGVQQPGPESSPLNPSREECWGEGLGRNPPGYAEISLSPSKEQPPSPCVRLTIGHSPDADDAFMFYALTSGLVPLDGPEPAEITAVHDDIQSLNERAQSAELDISQISAAAYPAVAHRYRITACGSSMGENYGPVVVAPRAMTPDDLAGCRIAVPGLHTTAFALARIYLP